MPTPHEDFLAINNGIACPVPCPDCCPSDCAHNLPSGCVLPREQRPPLCRIHLCYKAQKSLGMASAEYWQRERLFYRATGASDRENMPWHRPQCVAVELTPGCRVNRMTKEQRFQVCSECELDTGQCVWRPAVFTGPYKEGLSEIRE